MKRKNVPALGELVGLIENRPPLRQLDCTRIGEAAHARKRAEIMIERAVFLHQENEMIDI